MGANSKIEWTDATWNPVRGCTKVSPGCKHCYAETFAERFRGVPGHPFEQGFDLRLVESALDLPLRWRSPRRIFVNSVSDLFHEDVPNEYIAAVYGVMAATPRHTFQVLTKRAERLPKWFAWLDVAARDHGYARIAYCIRCATEYGSHVGVTEEMRQRIIRDEWPLPNVWMGVSVEDQRRAEERLPELARTRAATRIVSFEPLLGKVDLGIEPDATTNRFGLLSCPTCRGWGVLGSFGPPDVNGQKQASACSSCSGTGSFLDWAIVGSESGPGARPMSIAWARKIVDQCRDAGVACFTKQIATPEGRAAGDPKGGDPAYWPSGDWPREFPEVTP